MVSGFSSLPTNNAKCCFQRTLGWRKEQVPQKSPDFSFTFARAVPSASANSPTLIAYLRLVAFACSMPLLTDPHYPGLH